MEVPFAEYIGWFGVASYLVAYLLLSIRVLKPEKAPYHVLNILGSLGLIVNALHFNDTANLVVNGIWLLIALVTITVIIRQNRMRPSN